MVSHHIAICDNCADGYTITYLMYLSFLFVFHFSVEKNIVTVRIRCADYLMASCIRQSALSLCLQKNCQSFYMLVLPFVL